MLYVFKGKQVIAEIKGSSKAPVIELAYWAGNDRDLDSQELDLFFIECAEEIAQAAYTYQNYRISVGDKRDY